MLLSRYRAPPSRPCPLPTIGDRIPPCAATPLASLPPPLFLSRSLPPSLSFSFSTLHAIHIQDDSNYVTTSRTCDLFSSFPFPPSRSPLLPPGKVPIALRPQIRLPRDSLAAPRRGTPCTHDICDALYIHSAIAAGTRRDRGEAVSLRWYTELRACSFPVHHVRALVAQAERRKNRRKAKKNRKRGETGERKRKREEAAPLSCSRPSDTRARPRRICVHACRGIAGSRLIVLRRDAGFIRDVCVGALSGGFEE